MDNEQLQEKQDLDPLVSWAHSTLTPDEPIEEAHQGVALIRSQHPDKSDEELKPIIQDMHAQHVAQNQPQIDTGAINGALTGVGKDIQESTSNIGEPSISPGIGRDIKDVTSKTIEAPLFTPDIAPDSKNAPQPLSAIKSVNMEPSQEALNEYKGYNPEARAAALQKAEDTLGSTKHRIGNALQIFAQGFMKNPDIEGAIKNVNAQDEAIKNQALNTFKENKEGALEKYKAERQGIEDQRNDLKAKRDEATYEQLNTSGGELSKQGNDYFQSLGGKQDISSLSPARQQHYIDLQEKKYAVDEKNKTSLLEKQMWAAALGSRNADKATDAQNKAYTELREKSDKYRGNQAAQQAALGLYNGKKALDLINMGDPNNLSKQDLELFADELGKIALGGVPTEHGTQNLLPDTLTKKASEIRSYILNEPEPAKAAAFIKRNQKYLDAIMDTSQQVLDSYHENLGKGYKARVSPEQFDEFQQDKQIGPYKPKKASSSTTSSSGPKVGDVVKGYKFLGGDPTDQASWSKQ